MAEEKNISEVEQKAEDEKKTASKAAKPKEKKPNIFKRFGKYLKECKSECKKIVWAPLPATVKNTVMVVVTIIICTLVLWGLDRLFQTAIIDWLGNLYRAIR